MPLIERMCMWPRGSAVATARKKRNALGATTGQIAIHVHEPARQRARERATVPAFAAAQRQRRKVEALFAELKNQIGLRRVRLRRMKHVREQFFLGYRPEPETIGSFPKIEISRISHGSDLR